jgi:hypothetical protein
MPRLSDDPINLPYTPTYNTTQVSCEAKNKNKRRLKETQWEPTGLWGDRGSPTKGLPPPPLQNGDPTPPPRTPRATPESPESFPWLE